MPTMLAVDTRYLSVLFPGDDAFDYDEGYTGRGQYLFAMLGTSGDHGLEVDNGCTNRAIDTSCDQQPRTLPQLYGATLVGGGASGRASPLVSLQDGAGGRFARFILTGLGGVHPGVSNVQCGLETRTQLLQAASGGSGQMGTRSSDGYLYFSPNNIIYDASEDFIFNASSAIGQFAHGWQSCDYLPFVAVGSDPQLGSATNAWLESGATPLEPRPSCNGPAYQTSEDPSLAWFEENNFKGAFGPINWLDGWSYLNTQAGFRSDVLVGGGCTPQPSPPPPTIPPSLPPPTSPPNSPPSAPPPSPILPPYAPGEKPPDPQYPPPVQPSPSPPPPDLPPRLPPYPPGGRPPYPPRPPPARPPSPRPPPPNPPPPTPPTVSAYLNDKGNSFPTWGVVVIIVMTLMMTAAGVIYRDGTPTFNPFSSGRSGVQIFKSNKPTSRQFFKRSKPRFVEVAMTVPRPSSASTEMQTTTANQPQLAV